MPSRVEIRKNVKNMLKTYLKAPRNGKTFNSNVYSMTEIMKKQKNGYEKDFTGQLLEKYYFKYHTRFHNREKMNGDNLKGGSLEKYVKFKDMEGGVETKMSQASYTPVLEYTERERDLLNFPVQKPEREEYLKEQHTLLKDPNSMFGFKVANYMGAGTQIIDRLKRLRKGDKNVLPISKSDEVAMAHDILYSLAETPADIREADNIMLKDLHKVLMDGSDSHINIAQGKFGIKGKKYLEDTGLMDVNKYADFSFSKNLSTKDKRLLKTQLLKLQEKGIGKPLKHNETILLKPYEKKIDKMILEFDDEDIQDLKFIEEKVKPDMVKPSMDKPDTKETINQTSKKIDDDDLNILLKKLLNLGDTQIKPTVRFKGRKPIKLGKKAF